MSDPQLEAYSPFGAPTGWQPSPLFAQSAMPILGTGGPPQYTGMANFGGRLGGGGMEMVLNMALPALLQQFGATDRSPFQFFPAQNIATQLDAAEFYQNSQQAMQMAAQADTASLARTIGGFWGLTGETPSAATMARDFRWAGTASQMMPMLTQILGPDMVDSLHGSRGSATIFANQMHAAMRTAVDPVTGMIGMSGESAGRMSQSVYDNLFGADYDPSTLRGMSAGQAGMLAKELQVRGLLGVPLGQLSLGERRAALPADISEDTIRRIARDTPTIRELGEDATEEQLNAATTSVRRTLSRLKDPNAAVTQDDITGDNALPGAADLLRAADATRVVSRLKDMSGAVKAMRDIFGDMGNPNAPMRDIINGLNKLTQGGLSSMSPAQLEMTVRKTQAIANLTGVSVDGILSLTDAAAQIGDKMGLDRKQAVRAGQAGALFAAAAASVLPLGDNATGSPTVEHLAMAETQLQQAAAGARSTNQAAAAIRMVETGVVTPAEGSDLAKYIQAVRDKDPKFDFRVSDAKFMQMFEEQGVRAGSVRAILNDRAANDSFISKVDANGTIRGTSMRLDAIEQQYGPAAQLAISGLTNAGRDLVDRGIVQDGQQGVTLRDIGREVTAEVLAMDPKTMHDDKLQMAAVAKSYRQALIRRGATPAAADAIVTAAGGDNAVAATILAELGTAAGRDPMAKTVRIAHAVYGGHVRAAMEPLERRAAFAGRRAAALAGLGTTQPLPRMIDAVGNMGSTGLTADGISEILGGVPDADIAIADPSGALSLLRELDRDSRKLDPANKLDADQLNFNYDIAAALNLGGTDAKAALEKYGEDSRLTGNAKMLDLVRVAAEAGYVERRKAIREAAPVLWGMRREAVTDITRREDRVTAALDAVGKDGKPRELTQRELAATDQFLQASDERAKALLNSKDSLLHIGTGAQEDVTGLISDNELLLKAAKDKNLRVADLLRTDPQARAIYNRLATGWRGIESKYSKGSRGNTPMTQRERAELDSRAEVDNGNPMLGAGFDAQQAAQEANQVDFTAKAAEGGPLVGWRSIQDKYSELHGGYARYRINGAITDFMTDPSRFSSVGAAAWENRGLLNGLTGNKLGAAKAAEGGLLGGLLDDLRGNVQQGLVKTAISRTITDFTTDPSRFSSVGTTAWENRGLLNVLTGNKLGAAKAIMEAAMPKQPDAVPAQAAVAPTDSDKPLTVIMTGTFEEKASGRQFSISGMGETAARALLQAIS